MAISLINIFWYLVTAPKYVVSWLLDLVDINIGTFDDISNYLPHNIFKFSGFISAADWDLLNSWFPLEFAIDCFFSYVIIAVTVYAVNWILGLIPTVS